MRRIPEPNQARLVDQPVGKSQDCDITSGFARSLKLSAKRTRSPALTGESATAASWASLRRTCSPRDDIIGHIAYQHVCHHNLPPISDDVAQRYSRATRERQRQSRIYPS